MPYFSTPIKLEVFQPVNHCNSIILSYSSIMWLNSSEIIIVSIKSKYQLANATGIII